MDRVAVIFVAVTMLAAWPAGRWLGSFEVSGREPEPRPGAGASAAVMKIALGAIAVGTLAAVVSINPAKGDDIAIKLATSQRGNEGQRNDKRQLDICQLYA